jgi:hypothetical protein
MYESCGARVLPRTYYRLAREDMGGALYPGGGRLGEEPHEP